MPPTLHPHLKRGLDFDHVHVDPEDVIEDVPRKVLDPDEQAAKRRRIEKIAAQYLRGRRPVILAAGLRGPFNNGWRNPWAKTTKDTRRLSEQERPVSDHKTGIEPKKGSNKLGPAEARRRSRSAARNMAEQEPVASPETSRAVENDVEGMNDSYTLEVIEVPPATAPSPDEHDTSGATEFFSVDTGRCVRRRSPLTNPFWLRRPESEGSFDIKRRTTVIKDVSPTRSRNVLSHPRATETLQLAMPKVPLAARNPPARVPSHDITSSASASMAISSPVNPAAPTSNDVVRSSAFPVPGAIQTTEDTSSPPPQQPPQRIQTAASTQTARPSPVDPHRHSNESARPRGASVHERPSSEDIQRSAERLVDMLPPSSKRNSPPKRPSQGNRHVGGPLQQPQHEFLASPAPNSPTRFAYKKLGTKWNIGNAPRSKPRAMNFNSSPSVKKGATCTKPSPYIETVIQVGKDEQTSVGDIPAGSQNDEHEREQQSVEFRHSSGQSTMSTQAAMLLAQLEFQESTFPTSSYGASRPWSQIHEGTPRPIMPEVSPANTPLSIFRPQLEQPNALNSVLREAPISTQDLFAAASPFAFSTVKKKKPIAPQRSTLRVTITPFDGVDERGGNAVGGSPLSSPGRRPLQEKNTGPSPWKFTFEKDVRAAQAPRKSKESESHDDVGSPQLDLHGSMDNYGPSGSLHFADRLIRNLSGT